MSLVTVKALIDFIACLFKAEGFNAGAGCCGNTTLKYPKYFITYYLNT